MKAGLNDGKVFSAGRRVAPNPIVFHGALINTNKDLIMKCLEFYSINSNFEDGGGSYRPLSLVLNSRVVINKNDLDFTEWLLTSIDEKVELNNNIKYSLQQMVNYCINNLCGSNGVESEYFKNCLSLISLIASNCSGELVMADFNKITDQHYLRKIEETLTQAKVKQLSRSINNNTSNIDSSASRFFPLIEDVD